MNRPNVASAGPLKLATWHEQLADFNAGRAVLPVTVEIQPTERCNHKCPDCQAHYALGMKETRARANGGADLDIDLLDSLWMAAPEGVVISGNTGDPLLHPRIGELLVKAWAAHARVFLITNGQAMTERLAELVVRTCTVVRVSLDAWDAASFRRTHGATAEWTTVLAAIRWLCEARTSLKANCEIGVGYLTDEWSAQGMGHAASIARDLGADYIQFRPYHHRAQDVSARLADCRRLERDGFRIVSSDQKYAAIGSKRGYTTCRGANFVTVVDARGDLYMCCHHVGNPGAKIGSLAEQSWPEWVASQGRRDAIAGFAVGGCVPLCRLDAVNEALQIGMAPIPVERLTVDVARHRCFL